MTSHFTLGSNEFLEYNVDYSVLICRECEYAIQKSAVQSHLLRHKIYRGERRRLMDIIGGFDLREPDSVPIPDPTTPPIASLSLLDGYRCLHAKCTNLCASVKRMRRHWADVHGSVGVGFLDMAREVKMQTFFRGTKIRYFEVAPDLVDDGVDETEETENEEQLDDGETGQESQLRDVGENADDSSVDELMLDVTNSTSTPPSSSLTPESSPLAFDLRTLTIFHHLTSVTLPTLPTPHPHLRPTTPQLSYWHTTVLPLSLSKHYLTSGLLAISSYHLSTLNTDTDKKTATAHRSLAIQFSAAFVAGRAEASRHAGGIPRAPSNNLEEERKTGGQIMCVVRCAHWVCTEEMLLEVDRGFHSLPFNLSNFVTVLRGCFSLQEQPNESSGASAEDVFARAGEVLRDRRGGLGGDIDDDVGDGVTHTPRSTAMLDRLGKLPERMREVFGRPDAVRDVVATLGAIASLVEWYGLSLASETDDTEKLVSRAASWHSMLQFLHSLPSHFHTLLSRHEPAALVVLAHWAATLVHGAEASGCWFLRGLAGRLVEEIGGRLSGTDSELIRGLMDWVEGGRERGREGEREEVIRGVVGVIEGRKTGEWIVLSARIR